MFTVMVQILAPLHYAPGSYDWITVGEFDSDDLDTKKLTPIALELIDKAGYRPNTRIIRMNILNEEREHVDMILLDAW